MALSGRMSIPFVITPRPPIDIKCIFTALKGIHKRQEACLESRGLQISCESPAVYRLHLNRLFKILTFVYSKVEWSVCNEKALEKALSLRATFHYEILHFDGKEMLFLHHWFQLTRNQLIFIITSPNSSVICK